ncbi:MAG: ABC transporter permease [Acidimicrobiales bacterium]
MTIAQHDQAHQAPKRHREEGQAAAGHAGDLTLTVVSPKINLRQRVVAIWRYRELLVEMTRKELRVQYKDSVLGFLWSMLNPAITMLVYFVVFQIILRNGVPRYAIFLMCGVLVWNFFSTALPGACGSLVANSSIIKKVAFPREVTVLSQVGSSLVQVGFQTIVLVLFMAAFQRGPAIEYLWLVVPAMIALLLFTTALGILFAAINVRLRDMQHLLAVGLQVWFWATPIVYQYRLVRDRIIHFVHVNGHVVIQASVYLPLFIIYRLNPITPIVLAFQRALYASTSPPSGGTVVHVLPDHAGPWWYLWQLLAVIAFSLALMVFSLSVFAKREGSFAEEL